MLKVFVSLQTELKISVYLVCNILQKNLEMETFLTLANCLKRLWKQKLSKDLWDRWSVIKILEPTLITDPTPWKNANEFNKFINKPN